MNFWAVLFFVLIVGVLVFYIFLQRKNPAEAEVIAGEAKSLWQRLMEWAMKKWERAVNK